MNTWIFLGVAIVSEVFATSALATSDGFTRLVPSLWTVAGYTCAFYFLSLTLKTMPVGVAYAIWAGLGVILVALIGWVRFGQKLDGAALLGMALIISGVLVMNFFSKSVGH